MKNIVLDSNDIINKIRRISFEIIEKNIDEKEIYLIGILPVSYTHLRAHET